MLTLEEALERIRRAIQPLPEETVPLGTSPGRVVRQRMCSPVDLPRFDNSAMDGYAVRSEDLATASVEKPVALKLCGRVAAGEVFPGTLPRDGCVRIFTGSPIPEGSDAVVMQEDARIDPTTSGWVQFQENVRPWENVRLKGEDIRPGSRLVEPGDCLRAGRIGLLAAAGIESVVVSRRPVVGLLATGSELVEAGTALNPGRIHESNRPMLAALCDGAGAIPKILPLVPDSPEATRAALAQAFSQCDAVISSGGVSVGEFDFVRSAFEQLGGELDLWKVAIKPGKPFVFGRLRHQVLFGLPGNPVSAFVTFLLLVRPALRQMQGAAETGIAGSPGLLAEDVVNAGDRRHFLRVIMDQEGSVRSAGVQASHVLGSLAEANGLLDVPPQTRLAKGSRVRVLRIE